MSDFIVSARKYRPATFDTVVGQSSITNTLKNAIASHHLAQAFLFCGPRGVGKTTCARILAKTINCSNLSPQTEACDQCESCKSFNEGASLNVYELDAASNNSVDDIRNLVDQVRFAPQLGQYKVYIIDEVHMLSTSAFNAFLKTLEEPPKHAIFILATTERHKILPTILSRCQIFNFNRIRVEDIAKHLEFIAKNEQVQADADALHIIAQKADGALRDACSIFDQIVSFAGNSISYKAVIENLHVLDYDYYFKATDLFLTEDIPGSLLLFNEILNNGFDGHNFLSGIAEHLRNLLVCKDVSTLELLETGASIKEKYKIQSAKLSVPLLLRALNFINRADLQYKASRNPRLLVELCLMQLCSLNVVEPEKKNDSNIRATLFKDASASPQPVAAAVAAAEKTIPVADTTPFKQSPSAPEVPAKEEPKAPAAKKPLLKTSSPRIQGFINPEQKTGTDKETSTSPVAELPRQLYTEEQIETAWQAYAAIQKSLNKPNYAVTLSSRKPRLGEKNLIEFTVDNAAQAEFIQSDKQELLSFLRKEIQNYDLQLIIGVIKNDGDRKLYTPADKFKRMAEKNPALGKLRQQFDLDVDF
ncbi:MAG: DNA polymerase III subunit gamma/tau [Bacteroidia bacterium]